MALSFSKQSRDKWSFEHVLYILWEKWFISLSRVAYNKTLKISWKWAVLTYLCYHQRHLEWISSFQDFLYFVFSYEHAYIKRTLFPLKAHLNIKNSADLRLCLIIVIVRWFLIDWDNQTSGMQTLDCADKMYYYV